MTKTTRKQLFLTELKNCFGLISIAAQKVGITRQTVWNWQQSDPLFKQAIEDINASMVDQVQGFLLKEIQKGNMTGIIFFLKCKGGWIEKNEQVISPGQGVQHITFAYEVVNPADGQIDVDAQKKIDAVLLKEKTVVDEEPLMSSNLPELEHHETKKEAVLEEVVDEEDDKV